MVDMGESIDLSMQVMALLNDAVEAKKFDVRIIERNVERGVITADDVDKAIKKIPDDAENAEWVNVELLSQQEEKATSNGHLNHS